MNEKNDTLVSSVMRHVDSSTAHRFLEMAEHQPVSVDDTLALLGCPLGAENVPGNILLSKNVLFNSKCRGVPHTDDEKEREIGVRGVRLDSADSQVEVDYSSLAVTYDTQRRKQGSKVTVLPSEIDRRDRAHRKNNRNTIKGTGGLALSPMRPPNQRGPISRLENSDSRFLDDQPTRGLSAAQLDDLGTGNTQFDRVESELRRKNTLRDLRSYQDEQPPVYKKPVPKKDRRTQDLHRRLMSISKKKITSFIITANGSEKFVYPDGKGRDPFLIPKFGKIKERNEEIDDEDDDADTVSTLSPRGEAAPLSSLSIKSKAIRIVADYQKKKRSIQYSTSNLRHNRPSIALPLPMSPYTTNFEILKMSLTDVPPNAGLGLWGNPPLPQRRGNGRYVQGSSSSEMHPQKLKLDSAPKPFFSY